MIQVRLERLPAFTVCGRKTLISGQDNEQFGAFWAQCERDGLLKRLDEVAVPMAESATKCRYLGVSRCEKDYTNRAFDFYIATECAARPEDLDCFTIPACLWAVFSAVGKLPDSLVESEIYAMSQWLPSSPYRHADMPEMEGYPPISSPDGVPTEFWLPITPR